MRDRVNSLRPAALLWMSSNGEVACLDHAGSELRAAVGRYPDRLTHTTPENRWLRLRAGGYLCEGCGR